MTEWMLLGVMIVIGYGALVYAAYTLGKSDGFVRGHDRGYQLARKHFEDVRNVEPVILEPAEHRLLMEVLRDLVLEDHGTIH